MQRCLFSGDLRTMFFFLAKYGWFREAKGLKSAVEGAGRRFAPILGYFEACFGRLDNKNLIEFNRFSS